MRSKAVIIVVVLGISEPIMANQAAITANAIVAPLVSVIVTDPSLGGLFQVNPTSNALVSLYTNGTVSSSNVAAVMPVSNSGASYGEVQISGATGSTVSVTIIGPEAVDGFFPLTGPDSTTLRARLYQSGSQSASVGTLVTDQPFTYSLSGGDATFYFGADVSIPPMAVTVQNYSSGAMTMNLSYQ